MRELWELFLAFARVGLFTFGGGYAMLPMLRREVVEKHGWADEEQLLDWFAVSQCTPGIIAVNTATFVGAKQRKFAGAFAATLGVVTPSFLMILAVAAFIQSFSDNAYVASAFAGIRVCVCVLILNALVKILKKAVRDAAAAIVFSAVFFGAVLTGLSPVLFVAAAGAAGVAIQSVKGRRKA
ncbi:MAG: chromate transporter [Oscillospiraceae bacterium]|jgi:chromate transporter|nr:chromate transporter [Oscillospiraceae bacterium]